MEEIGQVLVWYPLVPSCFLERIEGVEMLGVDGALPWSMDESGSLRIPAHRKVPGSYTFLIVVVDHATPVRRAYDLARTHHAAVFQNQADELVRRT